MPRFIEASIEPITMGTFCWRKLIWYSESPDCTWLGFRVRVRVRVRGEGEGEGEGEG